MRYKAYNKIIASLLFSSLSMSNFASAKAEEKEINLKADLKNEYIQELDREEVFKQIKDTVMFIGTASFPYISLVIWINYRDRVHLVKPVKDAKAEFKELHSLREQEKIKQRSLLLRKINAAQRKIWGRYSLKALKSGADLTTLSKEFAAGAVNDKRLEHLLGNEDMMKWKTNVRMMAEEKAYLRGKSVRQAQAKEVYAQALKKSRNAWFKKMTTTRRGQAAIAATAISGALFFVSVKSLFDVVSTDKDIEKRVEGETKNFIDRISVTDSFQKLKQVLGADFSSDMSSALALEADDLAFIAEEHCVNHFGADSDLKVYEETTEEDFPVYSSKVFDCFGLVYDSLTDANEVAEGEEPFFPVINSAQFIKQKGKMPASTKKK